MIHVSESRRGQPATRHRPTGVDLILIARAMCREWLLAACARLSAKVARLVLKLVAQARPGRMPMPASPGRLRLSGRPVA